MVLVRKQSRQSKEQLLREPSVRDAELAYAAVHAAVSKRASGGGRGRKGAIVPRIPVLRRVVKTSSSRCKGPFTVQGLSLAFFAFHVRKIVTKQALVSFLRRMKVRTTDPQPRHLGMQNGFDFLVAGCMHPRLKRALRPGEYCLWSFGGSARHGRVLDASFSGGAHRAAELTDPEFTRIKARYRHHCACCGSLEGTSHLKNRRLVTRLERGHMDPRITLDAENCIPMCSMCNSVYKNRAVFNRNGYVRKWLSPG